ncbi:MULTISPECIES: autotransporter outer membrane beta-barrel domain-containing protein [Halomonas]|uniref:autotransporter outer membrane beta-barrel domain-containing protein n=1 Tax=Halomonas TaxID=2745 RepID=UPI001C9561E3|nr:MULTISPECIES: autotransporter outer membrane beta-barrel domain-containing protein [Halomonas]MBY6206157.1 autotransporter outer membrane beta-barrel domain-containing protein [Halomonas sp. DP3Y7-2]MBY6227952.1 autotransporter outer membrane beta-barrel domain-containing protein [Halomonas sp. DP3Y7-1]MCA0916019.1 autotransporter outer membrane beta-barrel domain-containing protein [Halomonas denitrificans]
MKPTQPHHPSVAPAPSLLARCLLVPSLALALMPATGLAQTLPTTAAAGTLYTSFEGRPLTLQHLQQTAPGSPDNRVTAVLNGRPIDLLLPPGTPLAAVNTTTPISLRADDGTLLFSGTMSELDRDETLALASRLGILDIDQSLYGALKQALARHFQPVTQRIDAHMQPRAQQALTGPGISVWTTSEVGDLDGETDHTGYSGDTKAVLAGVDYRQRNWLVGLAAGHSDIELYGDHGGRTDLGGELVMPYAAVALLDDRLVLDATLLYQDLDGEAHRDYLAAPIDVDGHRWGGRASGTYYLPRYHRVDTGLTLGGAYLEDDLDGDYLGQRTDYGEETGEVFAGAKLSTRFSAGRVYGHLFYHYDLSSDVDDDADHLDGSDDDRFVLTLGAEHRLGKGVVMSLSGQTTLGASDTEYDVISASLAYTF